MYIGVRLGNKACGQDLEKTTLVAAKGYLRKCPRNMKKKESKGSYDGVVIPVQEDCYCVFVKK